MGIFRDNRILQKFRQNVTMIYIYVIFVLVGVFGVVLYSVGAVINAVHHNKRVALERERMAARNRDAIS